VTLERFEELFARELRRIPARYKMEVHRFLVERRAVRHPGSLTGLYILGHYHVNLHQQGPAVTLYYGSFRRVFRGRGENFIRREIARTLAHELLHHWEFRSGIDDLGDDDRRKLAHWKKRLGNPTGERAGRDLIEALLFLFIVLLGIAVASKLAGG
jgi:hypothetical protein